MKDSLRHELVPQDTMVCISPHPDDAALSCGGLVAKWRSQNRPAHVITLFSGTPPPLEQLSPLARSLHHAWGDLPDPMAHRRQEDRCALDVLDCTGTWWDYHDAIYRHPAYDSTERLFGRPAEEDGLEKELVQRLFILPGAVLLFPLAIGHHVDHQLAFRVGWKLWERARQVAFYEDLPYVAWESGLHLQGEGDPDRGSQDRLEELDHPLYAQSVDVTSSWPTKLEAIACYTSQFDELARDGVSLLDALDRYAASLLPNRYAERLWWPKEGLWI
jgi:LmbE family N-acetylglucosaminyl deacetylase